MVLGVWGRELTTTQARRKAEALRGQVRDRRDPASERKTAQAATLAAEAEAKAAAASGAYTVEKLVSEWTEHHLAARSRSYRERVPAELRRALKTWLPAPADRFARTDAVRVLDAVKVLYGLVSANRLRSEARACWTWAVKRGALAVNPWEATPRPQAKETPRERVLTDAELGALYIAAGAETAPWGVLVRLLILTGQRRGEVAGMRWDELDLTAGTWALPGERTKERTPPHRAPDSRGGGAAAHRQAPGRCRAGFRGAAADSFFRVWQAERQSRHRHGRRSEGSRQDCHAMDDARSAPHDGNRFAASWRSA